MESLTVSASRLQYVLSAWASGAEKDAAAAKCSAMMAIIGEVTPNTLENQRGQALLHYLLDASRPVANVAAIFTQKATLVLHPGDRTVTLPEPVKGHVVKVVSTGDANFVTALKDTLGAHTLGAALKEVSIQEGGFAKSVVDAVGAICSVETQVELAPFMGQLLFVKDDAAMMSVEKAASLCTAVFRRFARGLLEDEIAKASPKTLFQLRELLCQKLEQPNAIHGLERLEDVADFSLAAGLTPSIFQQGCFVSQIQVSQEDIQGKTNIPLRGGVLVVRYGVKHRSSTAFFARTLVVEENASADAKDAYEFVTQVSDKVVELLRPGVSLQEVYAAVLAHATELNPTFATHLSRSLGFSTGLLVLESRGTISEKGTCVVSNGMAFVVRVVLEKVPDSKNGGTYDVELSDTVVVKDGEAMIRTKVARKLSEVLYEATEPEAFEQQQQRDLSRITRQGQATTVLTSREEQRDEQLKSLLRELHAELLAAGGKKGTQAPVEEFRSLTIGKLSLGEMQTFKPEESSPPQECQRGIHFQREKKVLWLPVCGQSVPFHVCTINKVEVKEEAEHQTLTITFHALQEANAGFKLNRTKVFVKELKYTSGRHDVFPAIQLAVQDAQRAVKNEDAAMKRSASSASSGKLEHATAPLRLPQVKMRPPLAMGRSAQNKGCVGDLQLHNNALLFTILSGPSVTMFFDNIKHIIFQPAVNSIYVIYHITLKKPIEVGTKTLTEIQFVAEVMESSEAASGARRSFDEEMDADQRDRARINATNKQFFNFARAVEEKSRIITQLPTTKFSFDGVHQKGMTTFKGSREVLWAVTELPPFTQSVEEVEVVSLERIIPGGSTFDMSLIFKDYNRNAVTISNIPTAHLEAVKDWCLSARLYYMESSVNPNWKVTMRDIRDDDEWDPWLQGSGWSLMNNDTGDGDEDEDGSSDSDSTYYEESDEESTDSDDSSWLEDEESDVDQGSDDEDDDSSASWDELDRKAEEHDRKHRRFSDDDEDRPRKRPRNAAAAAAAPAPAAPLARKAPASFAKSAVPPPRRF